MCVCVCVHACMCIHVACWHSLLYVNSQTYKLQEKLTQSNPYLSLLTGGCVHGFNYGDWRVLVTFVGGTG